MHVSLTTCSIDEKLMALQLSIAKFLQANVPSSRKRTLTEASSDDEQSTTQSQTKVSRFSLSLAESEEGDTTENEEDYDTLENEEDGKEDGNKSNSTCDHSRDVLENHSNCNTNNHTIDIDLNIKLGMPLKEVSAAVSALSRGVKYNLLYRHISPPSVLPTTVQST